MPEYRPDEHPDDRTAQRMIPGQHVADAMRHGQHPEKFVFLTASVNAFVPLLAPLSRICPSRLPAGLALVSTESEMDSL